MAAEVAGRPRRASADRSRQRSCRPDLADCSTHAGETTCTPAQQPASASHKSFDWTQNNLYELCLIYRTEGGRDCGDGGRFNVPPGKEVCVAESVGTWLCKDGRRLHRHATTMSNRCIDEHDSPMASHCEASDGRQTTCEAEAPKKAPAVHCPPPAVIASRTLRTHVNEHAFREITHGILKLVI